ncbi:MAG: hypothetical protein AAFU85_16385 [Planctomycetota bacterium]
MQQSFDKLFRAADWKLRAPVASQITSNSIAPDWDKRSSPRARRRQRVVMRADECDYGLLGVAIENESDDGIGFLSPIPLRVGQRIEIITRTCRLIVDVVRCFRQGVDCFEIGGRLKSE